MLDECHRVAMEGETQYQSVIARVREGNPALRVLGLTATRHRVGAPYWPG